MKRITFSGGSLVTSNAIAEAILDYTTSVTDTDNSVTVDITVLESNGRTSVHTLLLSPGSQFDVADADDITAEEEHERFPVPDMPQIGIQGLVESKDHRRETANQYDDMMREIDEGLGS